MTGTRNLTGIAVSDILLTQGREGEEERGMEREPWGPSSAAEAAPSCNPLAWGSCYFGEPSVSCDHVKSATGK